MAPGLLRAVLLDLDGTLVDPGRGVFAAVRAATDALGLPPPQPALLRRFVGPPIQEGFAQLLGLDEPQVERAIAVFRASYSSSGLYDCDVYPGVPAMLEELAAAGLQLAVATSKPQPFALRVLEHVGLLPAVASVHGATLDGAVRHKAQVVAAALRHLAMPAGQAVLLGDRAHDAAGARACGAGCLGAGWGYAIPGELSAVGVLAVADRPADVPGLLRR